MANKKLRRAEEQIGPPMLPLYSAEITIDRRVSALGRSFNDQRAAMLDAVMLPIESLDRRRRHAGLIAANGLVARIGEVAITRRDGKTSEVVARARYVVSDSGHEPLVEMIAPERR